MEILRALGKLFQEHTPETLMAIFGAGTSILLLYLINDVLQDVFGILTRSAAQEADQDQATAALMQSLVQALIVEVKPVPEAQILQMLRPEFDALHQAIQHTEARVLLKLEEAGKVEE